MAPARTARGMGFPVPAIALAGLGGGWNGTSVPQAPAPGRRPAGAVL